MSNRFDLEARLRALRAPTSTSSQSSLSENTPPPISTTTSSPINEQSPLLSPTNGTIRQVLGPEYDAAVQLAQQAIAYERQQHVRTAVKGYIQAGQQLIQLGRSQSDPQLQKIIRKKALALLQRAEKLSDWLGNSSDEAVAAAYQKAKQVDEQAFAAKQAKVERMQSENQNIRDKLHQVSTLSTVRNRYFRRNARRRQSSQSRRSSDASSTPSTPAPTDPSTSSDTDTSDVPLSNKKLDLVNELHARIGLPEINHLRSFQPLHDSATDEAKRQLLESELDAAQREARELRETLKSMEESVRKAQEESLETSQRVEQEKEDDLQQVREELARVRGELEKERRLSASFNSTRSFRSTDSDDPDAYENPDVIQRLRKSLQDMDVSELETDERQPPRQPPRQLSSMSSMSSQDSDEGCWI